MFFLNPPIAERSAVRSSPASWNLLEKGSSGKDATVGDKGVTGVGGGGGGGGGGDNVGDGEELVCPSSSLPFRVSPELLTMSPDAL